MRMASMCYLNYGLERSSLREVGAKAMPSESSSASESTSSIDSPESRSLRSLRISSMIRLSIINPQEMIMEAHYISI